MKFQIGKGITLIIFALLFVSRINAQKPAIDSTALGKWKRFSGTIHNNGNYIFYNVSGDMFLSSADNHWKKCFTNITGNSAKFAENNSKAVFQRNDSLFIVELGNEDVNYIIGVQGKFDLLPYNNDDLMLYTLKANREQLLVKSLATGKQYSLAAPEKYWFNQKKNIFLSLVKELKGSTVAWHLQSINLKDGSVTDIWQGTKIESLVFTNEGTACGFLSRDDKGETIWYADILNQKPVQILDNQGGAAIPGMKVMNLTGFNKPGDKLYFTMGKSSPPKTSLTKGVDVYSYKDAKLQSEQLVDIDNSKGNGFYRRQLKTTYAAMISLADKRILVLENDYAYVKGTNGNYLNKNWLLISEFGKGDIDNEWNWNNKALTSVCLLSLKDGSKHYLIKNVPRHQSIYYYLSPNEDYVVYYDFKKAAYYSYEIETGITRSIATRIHKSDEHNTGEAVRYGYAGSGELIGFTSNNRYLVLTDQYDIYKVDWTGKLKPENITAGYGRAHHIQFRMAASNQTIFTDDEEIILVAFNKDKKEEGFYRIKLNQPGKPDSLTMQPKRFGGWPQKAKNADAYLVGQEDERSFPNFYFSKDLKQFIAISDVHPEKSYNWLSTELVNYKLPDGTLCQGILYKPEDFDPHKKYPVIITYYTTASDNLHSFPSPEWISSSINIPFFVSNGYLVFEPDMHFKMGSPGQSSLQGIVTVAKLLSKRPYVNAAKIGINGHSWGGFQTNYIVAHTNMFAAAMSGSGMSDFVSIYGTITGDGSSRQRQYEIYNDHMGGSLWEMPEKYIENSAVLRADKITTPILILANDQDDNVAPQQGVELFTALRRLQKKAWMLQYDGEGHSVDGKDTKKDFTTRVFQFFNYYLKDMPPPMWMTKGVPAEEKGLFTGLEFDQSGNKP